MTVRINKTRTFSLCYRYAYLDVKTKYVKDTDTNTRSLVC